MGPATGAVIYSIFPCLFLIYYVYTQEQAPSAALIAPVPHHNVVFDVLRRFLCLLDLYPTTQTYLNTQLQPDLDSAQMLCTMLTQANQHRRTTMASTIRRQIDYKLECLQQIDASLQSNQQKLQTMEKNRIRQQELLHALQRATRHLQEEKSQLTRTLEHLVSDTCVAMTVLHRVGWLPEAKRHLCAQALRKHVMQLFQQRQQYWEQQLLLPQQSGQPRRRSGSGASMASPLSTSAASATTNQQSNTMPTSFEMPAVSLSPFVAGHLMDVLQVRTWCSYEDTGGLTKDIPSLNTLSLLHMTTGPVLVIDPDGVAAPPLLHSAPSHYDTYTVSAQKFTLSMFDHWVAQTTALSALPSISEGPGDAEVEEDDAAQLAATTSAIFENTDDFDDDMDEDVDDDEDASDASPKASRAQNRSKAKKSKRTLNRHCRTARGVYLVIQDVQAGASDDLLALLSARTVYPRQEEQPEDTSEEAVYEPSLNENETDLEFIGSNKVETEKTTRSGAQNSDELNVDIAQYIDATVNRSATGAEPPRHPRGRILLPRHLKIILVSTQAPALTSAGTCYPLPRPSLAPLTLLHWTTVVQQTACVDPSPILSALETPLPPAQQTTVLSSSIAKKPASGKSTLSSLATNPTIDHVLPQRLALKLTRHLLPHTAAFNEKLVSRNASVVTLSQQLRQIEHAVHVQVGRWLVEESMDVPETTAGTHNHPTDNSVATAKKTQQEIQEDIEREQQEQFARRLRLQAVSLSILSHDAVVEALLKSNTARDTYHKLLETEQTFLREQVAYLKCVEETLVLGADVVRVAGHALPWPCFAPHALTVPALVTHLVPMMVTEVSALHEGSVDTLKGGSKARRYKL